MTEDVTRDVTGWGADFDCIALHKLVNVNVVWTLVTSSSLPLKSYLVTEGVTECGAALGTRPRSNLCGIVLLKIATKHREWITVTDNSLRESFYSATGAVIEGGSVDVTRLTGGPGSTSIKEAVNENRV